MNKFLKFTICSTLLASASAAKITDIEATPENITNFAQIVDVRTPAEWAQTGVIKEAKLVSLVNDANAFKDQLEKAGVDLSKPVAFICRSGRRSAFAASLVDAPDRDIINIGGMDALIQKGYKTTPYAPKQ